MKSTQTQILYICLYLSWQGNYTYTSTLSLKLLQLVTILHILVLHMFQYYCPIFELLKISQQYNFLSYQFKE